MQVTLVFGAGGAAGWVFHAGVYETLAEETGWDPRSAQLVIGTSAGAAVAAALRAGADPALIVAAVNREPTSDERAEMREEMAAARRTLRPLAPGLVRHVLPGKGGAGVAVAGLLPPGWFPTASLRRFPGVEEHSDWPAGLWIPSVRVSDGAVVVFGRDRTDIPVAAAIEASSAVPGLFRPKQIGSELFLDGGLASPTHAHLAGDGRPDLVIVSSPMTRPSRRPMAILARRRIESEHASLTDRGIITVLIEPPEGSVEAFRGFPRRNPEAAPRILAMAASATRQALERARLAREWPSVA